MRNLNILIVSSFLFSIISCSGGTNYVGTGNSAQKTVSYEYSADSPTFDVADETTTVNVTGVKGKKLYLAKYNMESTSTPSDSIRVLSSATGLQSAQADCSADLVTNGGNSANDDEHLRSLLWAETPQNPSWLSPLEDSGINADLTPRTFTDDVEQINPVVGTTTKDLYIPYHNSNGIVAAYYRMTFVARAVGDHCIVWAPAETQSAVAQSDQATVPSELSFPDKTAGNAVFTDAMANDLRDKFELAYPYETKMFGEKAKKIFSTHDNNDKTQVDIKKLSDTAAYTNIVVYDFENSSNNKAIGFFTPNDYRPSYKTLYGTDWDGKTLVHATDSIYFYFSNEGNYIYLKVDDVIFDEKGQTKKAWVEANESSGTLVCYPDSYLTICHEYMHSLQYGRKIIEQGFSNWSVPLGETLGSLCEDVMENVLGVPKSYTAENFRVKRFCNEHYFSSVMDSSQNLNYSNLLFFGIYLTRNYGGARLIGDMVTNDDDGDWSCILKAIKNVAGVEKTEEQLMKEFLEQLLVADSKYTSNKNSAPLVVNGVDFTMPAVNMRNLSEWCGYELATLQPGEKDYEEYQQAKNGVKTYDAKDIIKKKTVAGEGVYDIRPRGGFNLHFIGTADSDTVSLVFSSVASGAKPPKMMIVVGE